MWEVEVFNETNGVLYVVYVTKESDPSGPIELASANRASASKEQATKDIAKFLRTQEHVLVLPTGAPFATFADGEAQEICPVVGTTYAAFNIASGVMMRALQTLLGTQPVITSVFNNGDVAQYRLLDIRPTSLGCQYEEGTARTMTGAVIDDGSGEVNNGDYVAPAVPGVFIVRVREGTWGYRYRSCGRVGSGPWVCEEYDE